jgi:hypothetical protein
LHGLLKKIIKIWVNFLNTFRGHQKPKKISYGLSRSETNLYSILIILSRGGRVLKSELKRAETKNILVVVFQKFKFAAMFTSPEWQLQLLSKY